MFINSSYYTPFLHTYLGIPDKYKWAPFESVCMPQLQHVAPESTQEACSLLEKYGDEAMVLSGGQSLMPKMRLHDISETVVVDVNNLEDADYVDIDDEIRLGLLVRHADVAHSEQIADANPALSKVASNIGDVQVRNRGTICGALAEADPSGEPPVLAALFDGKIVASDPDGETVYKGASFYTSPEETKLSQGELITEVRFPTLDDNEGAGYEKWIPSEVAWPVASVGAYLTVEDGVVTDARLYTGAVEEMPVRMADAEELLQEETPTEELITRVAVQVGKDTDAVEDAEWSSQFKAEIIKKVAKEALSEAVEQAR